MAEPDARIARRDDLRCQLVELRQQIEAAAPGSPERETLLIRFTEVHRMALALADELESE